MCGIYELEFQTYALEQAQIPALLAAERADYKDIGFFFLVGSVKYAQLCLIGFSLAVTAHIYAVPELFELFGDAEIERVVFKIAGCDPF